MMTHRILLLILWLPATAWAQLHPNSYTGNNEVTVGIEQDGRYYEYVADNMMARLNTGLTQLEFEVPDNHFYPAGSEHDMDLFLSLLGGDTTQAPLSLTLAFEGEQISLSAFEGQPLTFDGSIRLGDFTFKAPVQVVGYYQDNTLLLDFATDITGDAAAVAPYGIQTLKFTAQGVTIQNLTDQ